MIPALTRNGVPVAHGPGEPEYPRLRVIAPLPVVVRGPESGPREPVRPQPDRKGTIPMTVLRARIAAFLAVFSLLVMTGLAATGTPAAAASRPTHHPAQAAAGWLARQMTDGNHFVEVLNGTSFPDQGLTIDAIVAFAAARTADDYGARAAAWLARPSILKGYIGNGTTSSFAGATAKLLLATEVRGLDPATFGGVNLPARLAALLKPSGRYSDHSKFGDFSNAFSQALAVIATKRLGGAAPSAVSFLAGTECSDGGFPLAFGQKTCTSDPDATALDVQALLAAGRPGPARRGLGWLASVQRRDGGFASPPSTLSNANSTGLAGEALAVGGWSRNAARARAFLTSVQAGCAGKPAHRGALAFTDQGFRAATATRATAQGILGLADVGLARLSARGSQPGDPHLACSS